MYTDFFLVAVRALNMSHPATSVLAGWSSGLRRRIKAPVRKGVGSNPTFVKLFLWLQPEASSSLPPIVHYDVDQRVLSERTSEVT